MNRLNVCGFTSCGAFRQAVVSLQGLSTIFPAKLAVTVQEHATRDEYMSWLNEHRDSFGVPSHKTSPLVWFDNGKVVGGRDDTLAWCRAFINIADSDQNAPTELINVDPWNPNHGFDYDLVVIGGGSGGLACSKEAKRLGAKVAVLDFVKPSPLGSKWGLGGTCVNVGCIPKKLMHTAALLGEYTHDAASYGWQNNHNNGATSTAAASVMAGDTANDGAHAGGVDAGATHSWDLLRDHVQDHIKGLNFGYRVQLREKGVTYLNKLGKFVGPHQLECKDAKGNLQLISAARFVVAVGGRPSPLDCPGGELAISSDDLFSLSSSPGKTCVVGAGYVALECAGFLTGLHQGEVTVLVRSRPLRSFDRDVVERVVQTMTAAGTRILEGVVPAGIVKLPTGRLLVTFSSGEREEFDTVLCAIGRSADTASLGLESVGLSVSPDNGKLTCVNEQTSVPHVYAIGDVVQGAPELTPSAVLSGKLLSRRLFGYNSIVTDNSNSNNDSHSAESVSASITPTTATSTAALTAGLPVQPEYMDYRNVATTVFTPLELGTVGLTEDQAITEHGAENVDCFISSFLPLEWTMIEGKSGGVSCFTKIVVDKQHNNKVIGMHIAAPNAGEIIQGFAVAVKKGITHQDLLDTVGIHPTIAEEFTTMTIAKSSGVSAVKAGC